MVRFATPITLRLNHGDMLACDQTTARVRVMSGSAWITQRGDLVDHFLRQGQSFELRRGHGVVIGAEQELWLRFESEAGWHSGWLTSWQRMRGWLTGRATVAATVAG